MHIRRVPLVLDYPFSPKDLATHVRVDSGSELYTPAMNYGLAAATEIEHYGQLALLNQTIMVTLPCWPGGTRFPLPVAPVLQGATVSVTADGQAFIDFQLKTGFRPELWLTSVSPRGVVEITYDAGFGAQAAEVPGDLRHAILDQAAAFFDQRGFMDQRGGAQSQNTGLSPHAQRIVARYRRVGL